MLQNAANQTSLAFLDQKIAIMCNHKTLLAKYIINKENEQIEKKNNYSIIICIFNIYLILYKYT